MRGSEGHAQQYAQAVGGQFTGMERSIVGSLGKIAAGLAAVFGAQAMVGYVRGQMEAIADLAVEQPIPPAMVSAYAKQLRILSDAAKGSSVASGKAAKRFLDLLWAQGDG